MIAKLLFGVGFFAFLFIVCCAYLYVRQDELLFYKVANDPALLKQWHAYRVTIPAGDTLIEGWWADNPRPTSGPVVIYFGGNAEDVLHTAANASSFAAARILVTNYRGYGMTPGKPSQKALFADALVVYDYVVNQPGASPESIVLIGRSLGSGVATYLAAHRRVHAVVLITPYDSIAAVAQGHYSYFPVRWLLRNPFPSMKFARQVKAPMTIICGETDSIVPVIHAQRLFEAWGGPKQIHVLDAVGHNDIQRHTQYYPLINSFLER